MVSVTSYIPANYVMRLIVCGNKRLTELLTRFGGVQSLFLPNAGLKGSPLPRSLSCFHNLRSLTINSVASNLNGANGSLLEGFVLPKLEVLAIKGIFTDFCVLGTEKATGTWIDLNPLFPSLRTLALYISQWSWAWVDRLPTGLTSLSIQANFTLPHETAKAFPPNLTSLKTIGAIPISEAGPALITVRESLTELSSSYQHIDLKGFNKLLHLSLPLDYASPEICRETCDNLVQMPLVSLELRTSGPVISKFPSTLTRLVLSVRNFITNDFAEYLPHQLTHFDLVAISLEKIGSPFFSALPRTLLDLRLDIGTLFHRQYDPSGCIGLPSTLKPSEHMTLLDAFLGSSPPPSLTQLFFPGLHLIDDIGVGMLPKSITSLDLWFNPKSRLRWSPTHQGALTEKGLARLPTSLKILHMPTYTGAMRVSDVSTLPQTLQKLQIRATLTVRALAHFPAHLTWLELLHHSVITDDHIPLLPRSLTHLSFRMPQILSVRSFSGLPSNLTSIHLHNWGNRGNENVKLVPRGVTKLVIAGATNLTKNCVPNFPPNLRHLTINKCEDWEVCTAKELPTTLVKLVIRKCRGMTPSALSHLVNLRWLELRSTAGSQFFCSVPSLQYLRGVGSNFQRFWGPYDPCELLD
jgi:hypothetical protein